jgi:hypothetical protein
MASPSLAPSINFGKYPIDQPGSPAYASLLDRARTSLKEENCCRLPGFLTPEGIRAAQAECAEPAKRARSNQAGRAVNCYYGEPDATLSSSHPHNVMFDREFGVIRDDMIALDATLRSVYGNRSLMRFIADVLGLPRIYQSRDNYQALTVNVMHEGDSLHWHFDCNACAITLGVQEPEAGGNLEFLPNIGRHNHADIEAAMHERPDRLPSRAYRTEEGALIFFCGGESLHRVQPVRGERVRMVAALQYHDSDDAFDTPETTERIYGVPASEHVGPKAPAWADGSV